MLLWVVAVFTVLAVVAQLVREWAPGSVTANGLVFVDATREQSIPTLFSTLLLLACAGLLVAVASRSARLRTRWRLLAAVTAFLGIDEAISMHEATIPPLRRLLDADGILYSAWVVPAALFLGSAIGIELVEGWIASSYGDADARLIPASTTQEALELTGVVLFLYVLMDRLAPWQAMLRLSPR